MMPFSSLFRPLWTVRALVLAASALLALALAACGAESEPEVADGVPAEASPVAQPTGRAGLAVGDPAPDFTLPAATGERISLSDYTGQGPVLLFFHMAEG